RARCAAWERQRHFDAAYGFGLFLTSGQFAGEVSLGSVQRGPFQMGYIGYWIDEACGGHEYVPEGVVLLIRFAFETLRLHRLEAAIVPRNEPSRRVAEKLGLRDEGTAARFLQIRGRYEDHIRYAITREEWGELGALRVDGERDRLEDGARPGLVEPRHGPGLGLEDDLPREARDFGLRRGVHDVGLELEPRFQLGEGRRRRLGLGAPEGLRHR